MSLRSSVVGGLLLAALLGTAACGRRGTCAGLASCFAAEAARCQQVPGCQPVAGCVANPLGADLECAAAGTAAACAAVGSGCAWSQGACVETCNQIDSEAQCTLVRDCVWSACAGTAKPCRSYSADECPISPIGCYVEAPEGI